MLTAQLKAISEAIEPFFDRVESSFERLNIFSHLNDTLAYTSVESYTQKGDEHDLAGNYSVYEATVRIGAAGSVKMTAARLSDTVDSNVIPAIAALDVGAISITRHSCEYSKEHGRYIIFIDIKLKATSDGKASEHTVSIGTNEWYIFNEVSMSSAVKLYKFGMTNGDLACGVSRPEPKTVTLKTAVKPDTAISLYSQFSAQRGVVVNLTVDSVLFSNMVLRSADCDISRSKGILTLEYCEVTG